MSNFFELIVMHCIFSLLVGTHPDMFSNSSASQMAAAAVAAAYPYTFYTAAAASNIYDVGNVFENFDNL